MSIDRKMVILVGMSIAAMLGLVILGQYGLSGLKGTMDQVVKDEVTPLLDKDVLPLLKESVSPLINQDFPWVAAHNNSWILMLEADRDVYQALVAEKDAISADSPEALAKADKDNSDNIGQAEERMKKASAVFDSEDTKNRYRQFESAFGTWKQASRNTIAEAAKKTPGLRSTEFGGDKSAFQVTRDFIDKLQGEVEKELTEFEKSLTDKNGLVNQRTQTIEDKRKAVLALMETADRKAVRGMTLFAAIGVAFTLAAIVGATLMTRSITRPLKKIIGGLTFGAQQVASAAEQVAKSSQQMAHGAGDQASRLEETSAALEELTAQTRQNADNAGQANAMATEVRDAAQNGEQAMARMVEAINRIKASSNDTARIIKTIDEIAFQTNLLALNAAVEAARAGEAGKGFAVVAEEVRTLARRSAEAAKNTSELIESAQHNSESGVAVCDEVAAVLRTIGQSASKVTAISTEVSTATREQSQGIDQITTAVSDLDGLTQANAANSEEAAGASTELSKQADDLHDIVESLETLVRGRGKAAQSQPVPDPSRALARVPATEVVVDRRRSRAKA